MKLVNITAENVGKLGFFCRMSKMKTTGNQKKLDWLKLRFKEGLRIKMLPKPERGFIEYIPGRFAWRSINADGYMVIHCIWVVGKSKGNDFGDILINECLRDAKEYGMNGVAVVTSEGNWMTGKKFFLDRGFETVDKSPGSFELLTYRFKNVASPAFIGNWEAKSKKFGNGISNLKSPQCPYNEDAKDIILSISCELNIPAKVIELNSAEDIRNISPSPYGTFNIVYDRKFFSYEYFLPKQLKQKLIEFKKGNGR